MKYLICALLAALAASLAATWVARREVRDIGFYADSLQAASDTAALVHVQVLGDTMRAYRRRIIQTQLRADSLDKALKDRPVVRLPAVVRIDTLRLSDTVAMQPDSTYHFKDQQGPFHITTDVRLIGPMAAAHTTLASDPIPVEVRIGCGKEKPVSRASIAMLAPSPLSLVPGQVVQGQGVCNPSRPFLAWGASIKTTAEVAAVSIAGWEVLKQIVKLLRP